MSYREKFEAAMKVAEADKAAIAALQARCERLEKTLSELLEAIDGDDDQWEHDAFDNARAALLEEMK